MEIASPQVARNDGASSEARSNLKWINGDCFAAGGSQ